MFRKTKLNLMVKVLLTLLLVLTLVLSCNQEAYAEGEWDDFDLYENCRFTDVEINFVDGELNYLWTIEYTSDEDSRLFRLTLNNLECYTMADLEMLFEANITLCIYTDNVLHSIAIEHYSEDGELNYLKGIANTNEIKRRMEREYDTED